MRRAVVVLSGGQDSATCCAWAANEFRDIHCLSFDYGQRHRRELEAARAIAGLFQAPHTIVEVPVLRDGPSSALTNAELDLTATHPATGLPLSFVPGRNLIFLAQAAAFGIARGIHDLVTGVCETDYSGYPDCRQATIKALETAIYLGNENLVRHSGFRIHTPLMYRSKAETVKLAMALPGGWYALALSWTCYEGGESPCGVCPACVLRSKGFAEAGETDPALV